MCDYAEAERRRALSVKVVAGMDVSGVKMNKTHVFGASDGKLQENNEYISRSHCYISC